MSPVPIACMPSLRLFDIFLISTTIASLFYLFKAPVYYAFILLYRDRGTGTDPVSVRRVLGLTILRMVLGYLLLAGTFLVAAAANPTQGRNLMIAVGFVWLYGGRWLSWCIVASWGLKLRGPAMYAFSGLGVLLNLGCEGLAFLAFWSGGALLLLYVPAVILSVVFLHRRTNQRQGSVA